VEDHVNQNNAHSTSSLTLEVNANPVVISNASTHNWQDAINLNAVIEQSLSLIANLKTAHHIPDLWDLIADHVVLILVLVDNSFLKMVDATHAQSIPFQILIIMVETNV